MGMERQLHYITASHSFCSQLRAPVLCRQATSRPLSLSLPLGMWLCGPRPGTSHGPLLSVVLLGFPLDEHSVPWTKDEKAVIGSQTLLLAVGEDLEEGQRKPTPCPPPDSECAVIVFML